MTEASRVEFEAEFPVPEGCHYLVVAKRYSFVSPDIYYHIRDLQDQNTAWVAWQAARASVVVELPKEYGYFSTGERECGFNDALEQCTKAIIAAGASVKSA